MADQAQLMKLKLKHDQKLRGRVVEFSRNPAALVGPGRNFAIRVRVIIVIGVVDRWQKSSPS